MRGPFLGGARARGQLVVYERAASDVSRELYLHERWAQRGHRSQVQWKVIFGGFEISLRWELFAVDRCWKSVECVEGRE